MANRKVRFDMNELARVAASSIGAERCVQVEKCPDGLYNKAYVFRMSDGREVIGKVPNPNAGLTHYTTASEVATMDFVCIPILRFTCEHCSEIVLQITSLRLQMRNILSTPTPKVLAWNSRVESSAVGAEYIVMEKAHGIPLSCVWGGLTPPDKLKILLQVHSFMKAWLEFSFPGYGSIYYSTDIQSGESLPVHTKVVGERFAIGPPTGRDWCDAGRQRLKCDRGPCQLLSYTLLRHVFFRPKSRLTQIYASGKSALAYRKAIATRERVAIQCLPELRKHNMVMLTGPGLYQPTSVKKLWALDAYLQLVEYLLPTELDPDMIPGRIWHDDMHDENIFVDPANPTQITAIIDWQSTQVAPLFDHQMEPAFLEYDGPEIGENLEVPVCPDTEGLSERESAAVFNDYMDRAVVVGWRRLVRGKSPVQHRTAAFHDSIPGNMLHVAKRIYEIGEAHLSALVLKLRDQWANNLDVNKKKIPGGSDTRA